MRRVSATPAGADWSPGGTPPMASSVAARLAGIVLPDADERPVRLGSLWADGPAVLAFLRHYG
jgi:hypothetical protein